MEPTLAYSLNNTFALSMSDNITDRLIGITPIALAGLTATLLLHWGIKTFIKWIIDIKPDHHGATTFYTNVGKPNNVAFYGIGETRTGKNFTKLSLEQMNELSSGWKMGDRVIFDRAMFTGDQKTIKDMISAGRVPKDYAKRFGY